VPNPVVERAFDASRRFHALPLADKLKLKLNDNNIGYLPINASVQGASTVHKKTQILPPSPQPRTSVSKCSASDIINSLLFEVALQPPAGGGSRSSSWLRRGRASQIRGSPAFSAYSRHHTPFRQSL
jgi:hypothetical protein